MQKAGLDWKQNDKIESNSI